MPIEYNGQPITALKYMGQDLLEGGEFFGVEPVTFEMTVSNPDTTITFWRHIDYVSINGFPESYYSRSGSGTITTYSAGAGNKRLPEEFRPEQDVSFVGYGIYAVGVYNMNYATCYYRYMTIHTDGTVTTTATTSCTYGSRPQSLIDDMAKKHEYFAAH